MVHTSNPEHRNVTNTSSPKSWETGAAAETQEPGSTSRLSKSLKSDGSELEFASGREEAASRNTSQSLRSHNEEHKSKVRLSSAEKEVSKTKKKLLAEQESIRKKLEEEEAEKQKLVAREAVLPFGDEPRWKHL